MRLSTVRLFTQHSRALYEMSAKSAVFFNLHVGVPDASKIIMMSHKLNRIERFSLPTLRIHGLSNTLSGRVRYDVIHK